MREEFILNNEFFSFLNKFKQNQRNINRRKKTNIESNYSPSND